MKLESPKYLDDETKQKGRLAIGLIVMIGAMTDIFYVFEHGKINPSLETGRWSWFQHLFSGLFGPFGPSSISLIIGIALAVPPFIKLLKYFKEK